MVPLGGNPLMLASVTQSSKTVAGVGALLRAAAAPGGGHVTSEQACFGRFYGYGGRG